jgi:exonuclease III
MRIVGWNIRAGGGRRADAIAGQLCLWHPDVVTLSEFRGTAPSCQIAWSLRNAGLYHQQTTADPRYPAVNALLVASRWAIRRIHFGPLPYDPMRWLAIDVAAPQPFTLLSVHVPNRVSGRKYPFLDAITRVATTWQDQPALVIGDTNSGRIGIDEQTPAFNAVEDRWMAQMEALGWHDAFRWLHHRQREFTWYSPNGNNGFRLDQAFVHRCWVARLTAAAHVWGGDALVRRDVLSDHAALLIDFEHV